MWDIIFSQIREFFYSLRFRILIIILIVSIIPLIFIEVVLLRITENTVIQTRMMNVTSQFAVLSTYFSQTGWLSDMSTSEMSSSLDQLAGVFMSRIELIDRDFNIIIDTYQINKGKICISRDVNQCFNGVNSSYADKENQCIIMTQGIVSEESDEIEYVIFATSSISDIITAVDSVRLIGLLLIVVLVILILFLSGYSSFLLVKPFKSIDDAIGQIDKGDTSEQIELAGCSELEKISGSFNLMMSDIEQMEASRQEFVSNVSHELKTPITSMKVLADSLLQQEDVPLELYREFMGDIANEIDRENAIIQDLLTLVRLENASESMNIDTVNISKLIEDIMKMLKPLASERNIDLVMESFGDVFAEVDETKFSMAVSNLIENAVKYNIVEGWIHVSLNSDQSYFYVKVADSGCGIPEDAVEHVFDRFYRVDKARSRDTGGTGLGLAITKSIVVAHGGEIRVSSEENSGSTFIIQMPLTFAGSR